MTKVLVGKSRLPVRRDQKDQKDEKDEKDQRDGVNDQDNYYLTSVSWLITVTYLLTGPLKH